MCYGCIFCCNERYFRRRGRTVAETSAIFVRASSIDLWHRQGATTADGHFLLLARLCTWPTGNKLAMGLRNHLRIEPIMALLVNCASVKATERLPLSEQGNFENVTTR